MAASDTLAIRSDPQDLETLFCWTDGFCVRAGLGGATHLRLKLLLEEVVVNVMMHGYRDRTDGPIAVRLTHGDDGRIEALVTDEAPAFDPLTDGPVPQTDGSVDARSIGGLGIHFVRTLASSVEYRSRDGRNVLRMVVDDVRDRSC